MLRRRNPGLEESGGCGDRAEMGTEKRQEGNRTKEQCTDEIDGQGSGNAGWQLGRQCPNAPGWGQMGRPGLWLTPREAPSPDFERLEKVGPVPLSRPLSFYPNTRLQPEALLISLTFVFSGTRRVFFTKIWGKRKVF